MAEESGKLRKLSRTWHGMLPTVVEVTAIGVTAVLVYGSDLPRCISTESHDVPPSFTAGYYLLDRNGPGQCPDWINKLVWEAELNDQGSEPTPKEEDLDDEVKPECTTP